MGDPWRLWLALGALLGVAERFTARLYFGPTALGALAGAVAAAAGGSLSVQAGAFAAVTAAGLALRGTLLARYQRAAVRRGGIVRSVTVTEPISGHRGRVRYAGRQWRALSSGQLIPAGTKVTVVGLADETTLLVHPKEAVKQAVMTAQAEPVHRVSWREASKARGKLSGGYPLTPEERMRLADVSHQRWRYTDRLWGRVMVSFVGLMSAVVLALSPLGLAPAIRAAQGEGVRGVFIAQTLACSRTCQWTGTFTSADQIVHGVVYDDSLPASTRAGSMVPALYPGGYGSKEVFAVHGSAAWHLYVVIISLAAAGLAGSLWLGPVRYLRRRHRARLFAS